MSIWWQALPLSCQMRYGQTSLTALQTALVLGRRTKHSMFVHSYADRGSILPGFTYSKASISHVVLSPNSKTQMQTSDAMIYQLRPYLPALKRLARSWLLLYSLDQHGISLNTLYTRCEAHQGSALLVLRDSNDAVFGVWMGEGIKQCKGSYYGRGES